MSDKSSSHRLVGKFFTNSTPPSFDETEQSLRKQWVLSGDMTVENQGVNGIFMFEFRQENDKKKVLENGPYNVNGVIIVIKDLNSSPMIDFTVASFYVFVVGLPSYLCDKNSIEYLKSLVGYENPVLSLGIRNNIVSFLMEIDLKKPLKPGFYIGENSNRFVGFKYRHLGDFCYNCGMISHVKSNCNQVRVPTERDLTDTSRTHVYGPWLRLPPLKTYYQTVLMKSDAKQNGFDDCQKSLSYAQFFIEIEYNLVAICIPKSTRETTTKSTHRFRFPCSYLDTETESTDFTTSKSYEVLQREICENSPFMFRGLEHELLNKPEDIGSLVDQLKTIKKDKFSCDDKWLTLKLQINKNLELTPVDYESLNKIYADIYCERLIESKISDLIKNRVEKNEDLLSLSSWENQIREMISEMGFTHCMHTYDVSRRANQAMMKAVQMEISSSISMVPADKSTVFGLERFKVLGSDMDRLNPCMICVGEMFLGEEATNLPCSHVFHKSCIENWLLVGHKCPLCGFKLPSQK